jgi:hypothetical protein
MNVYQPLIIFNITHSIILMTDGCTRRSLLWKTKIVITKDLDADLHGTLVEKLFPLRATVLSAADFLTLQPME